MVPLTYQLSEVAKTDTENATRAFRDLSNDQIASLVRLMEQAPPVFSILLKTEFFGRGFGKRDAA
jgi:hypothetical protein